MKRLPTLAAALTALFAAGAAQAGDLRMFGSAGPAGWHRQTGAAAVAYFTLPFHAARTDAARPGFGIAMTAPQYAPGARVSLHTDAPRLVDMRFSGKDFVSPWNASLSVGDAIAWTSNPDDLPRGANARLLGESGVSWAVVGAATVALGIGIFMITEDDVPPDTTGE